MEHGEIRFKHFLVTIKIAPLRPCSIHRAILLGILFLAAREMQLGMLSQPIQTAFSSVEVVMARGVVRFREYGRPRYQCSQTRFIGQPYLEHLPWRDR